MPPKKRTKRAPRPVSQADHARVCELHAEGWSRNAIARELDRSLSVITKIARSEGLSFDRAATKAATAAKVADTRARRAQLALDLLADAERMRRQLWEPAIVWNIGGKDNTYTEHHVDKPPFRDQRDIAHTTGTLIDQHAALEKLDTESGADGAKSMLGALAAGLQAAADEINGTAT